MTRLFAAISLLLSCHVFAQGLPSTVWLDPEHHSLYSITSDSTWARWESDRWVTKRSLLFKSTVAGDWKEVEQLNYVPGSAMPLFIGAGTQQVYRLDTVRGLFERLDKSVDRGMNHQAIQWVQDDTLFSLGGRGHWHAHAVLSYFNSRTGRWENLSTSGGPSTVTSDLYQWDTTGQFLYTTWDPENGAPESDPSTELWKLDVRGKKWSSLGMLSEEAIAALRSDNKGIVLPIGYYIDNEKRLLLDLVRNRMDFIDPAECDVRIHANSVPFNGTGAFAGRAAVYNFDHSANSNTESIAYRYTYSCIKNARRTPVEIIESGVPILWWIGLIGGALLMLLALFQIAKVLRKPFVKGSTASVEESFFNTLDQREVTLLRALLRSGMRGTGLKSEEISEIMGWDDKSLDNQRKWRNNTIKALNQRAEEHIHIPELILRERDPNDKRERVYRLAGDGFRLLRDSIHFS